MRLEQSDLAKSNGYLRPGSRWRFIACVLCRQKAIFDDQEASLHCGSAKKHREVILCWKDKLTLRQLLVSPLQQSITLSAYSTYSMWILYVCKLIFHLYTSHFLVSFNLLFQTQSAEILCTTQRTRSPLKMSEWHRLLTFWWIPSDT